MVLRKHGFYEGLLNRFNVGLLLKLFISHHEAPKKKFHEAKTS